TIHFWKRSKLPVTTRVLKMTTPQRVIQLIDQPPCKLPKTYDSTVLEKGAPQTQTAMRTVTMLAIKVESQAVTRKTASRHSSTINGTRARRTVIPRLCSGTRI